ncbi:MAG: thioredoxin family protein [Kiritimatiellae bacterium]|nr:thioredoxin family protein [Kiritimatiellia bacterium]
MNNDIEKKEDSSCGCGSGSCCSGPGKWIWIALAVAVVGVLIAKNAGKRTTDVSPAASEPPAAVEASAVPPPASEPATQSKPLPRLVDLGAHSCIPCKMMAPILEDLRKTYAGKMDVVFIDVWQNPDAGKRYGINVIPTQIFYDATGKELFRHEGFFGKDDILAKWKELGVAL